MMMMMMMMMLLLLMLMMIDDDDVVVDDDAALVDIPVGKSRIHSLHVLFTLFSEFKALQVC